MSEMHRKKKTSLMVIRLDEAVEASGMVSSSCFDVVAIFGEAARHVDFEAPPTSSPIDHPFD